METSLHLKQGYQLRLVLTVPMRNGNNVMTIVNVSGNMCSYRTYEEWKPKTWCCAFSYDSSVLTVPMRNGNDGEI